MARELFLVNQMLDDLPHGIFLVDRCLRLSHANAAGRTLLQAGKGLRLDKGQPPFMTPRATRDFGAWRRTGAAASFFCRLRARRE